MNNIIGLDYHKTTNFDMLVLCAPMKFLMDPSMQPHDRRGPIPFPSGRPLWLCEITTRTSLTAGWLRNPLADEFELRSPQLMPRAHPSGANGAITA